MPNGLRTVQGEFQAMLGRSPFPRHVPMVKKLLQLFLHVIHNAIVCMPLLVPQTLDWTPQVFHTSISTAAAAAVGDEVREGIGRVGEDRWDVHRIVAADRKSGSQLVMFARKTLLIVGPVPVPCCCPLAGPLE